MSPLQDEPRYELLEPPFFGSAPSPFEAPESQLPTGVDDPLNPLIPLIGSGSAPSPFEAPESPLPTGMDDPLNPLIPLSEQPEPLLTSPYDGQSPPQATAAVPEPSVIGLMLLGLAALGWTGRRRLTPTRRA